MTFRETMSRMNALRVAVLAVTLTAVPSFADETLRVAIAYFDNNSADPSLDPLARGLADMLITDLSNVQRLTLIEREKLNLALDELKLSKTKFVDPKVALSLGKGLSARYLLVGGYVVAKDTMRLDARLFDVPASKIVFSEKVDGQRDEFFALEKELVELLIKSLDLKLPLAEKTKTRAVATQSFDAFSKYSQGLAAKDAGDQEKARALFAAALEADPNYRAAQTATERLGVIFKRDDKAQSSSFDDLRKGLDPKAPDFAVRVDQLFMKAAESLQPEMQLKKVELLKFLAERDLFPVNGGFSRALMEANSVIAAQISDPAMWDAIPRACEYLILKNPEHQFARTQCRVFVETVEKMRPHTELKFNSDELPELIQARRALLTLYASKVKK